MTRDDGKMSHWQQVLKECRLNSENALHAPSSKRPDDYFCQLRGKAFNDFVFGWHDTGSDALMQTWRLGIVESAHLSA